MAKALIENKWEKLYRCWGGIGTGVEVTQEGVRQWREYDTHGKPPSDPTPYFLAVDSGKRWYGFDRDRLRDNWLHPEKMMWDGFDLLREDWKGQLWVLKDMLTYAMGRTPPEYVYTEDDKASEAMKEGWLSRECPD